MTSETNTSDVLIIGSGAAGLTAALNLADRFKVTVLAKGQTVIVYQVADPNRSKRADEQWKKTPRARRGKVAGARADRTASSNVPDDTQDAAPDEDEDKPAAKPDSATSDVRKDGGPVTNPAQMR